MRRLDAFRQGRWHYGLVAAILLAYYAMAISASRHLGPATDEPGHLVAGYTHWRLNDFRYAPENGRFPESLAALPLILDSRVKPDDESSDALKSSTAWTAGHRWFFDRGNDPTALLLPARAMVGLLGLATGLVVFYWSRKMNGPWGGLVSLLFFAFSPTMLGHGAVVTSDMAAALGFICAAGSTWALLAKINFLRVIACGLSLALLALSKLSAPLFALVALLMLTARLIQGHPLEIGWPFQKREIIKRWGQGQMMVLALVCAVAISVASVWAGYGFRSDMYAPGLVESQANRLDSDAFESMKGTVPAGLRWARAHRLLPDAWLFGFESMWLYSRARPSFLNGEYRMTGWWNFFPYAFMAKTEPALFAALGIALIALLRGIILAKNPRLFWAWMPLAAFVAVYGFFCLTSKLNIGHRHLLPIYPALYIIAGSAVLIPSPRLRSWQIALTGLLASSLCTSLLARPNYLSYFNWIAGGSRNGWRHLVDSSLDWGQDLPALRQWLDEHAGKQPVFLSYFGADDPRYWGIKAQRVADGYFDHDRSRRYPAILKAGLFAISATQLQQVYPSEMGKWDDRKEQRYHLLIALLRGSSLGASFQQVAEFEQLQFGRLCRLLREETPVGRAGHSILIFEVNESLLRKALYGSLIMQDGQ